MRWFDTHCHLDCDPLEKDVKAIVKRAREALVEGFLVPGICGETNLSDTDPGVFKAWGFHPWWSKDIDPKSIPKLFSKRSYHPIAIGECGLDNLSGISQDIQRELFVQQINLARIHRLPLLIHQRGKWQDGLQILKSHGKGLTWVFHAFSGSWETARELLEHDSYISFAGSLCRGNAKKTPRVAELVPIERILVETDSPDLSPPDWKKPHNEPASLPLIAAHLAQIRKTSLPELSEAIWENTIRAFPTIFETVAK